jgi:hypothetical protein
MRILHPRFLYTPTWRACMVLVALPLSPQSHQSHVAPVALPSWSVITQTHRCRVLGLSPRTKPLCNKNMLAESRD